MSIAPNHMLRMRSDYPGDKCSLGGCSHAKAQITRLVEVLREARGSLSIVQTMRQLGGMLPGVREIVSVAVEEADHSVAKINALLREYDGEKRDE